MAASGTGHSVVTRAGDHPSPGTSGGHEAMHPPVMYDIARAKNEDEQRAADPRRLARAEESRPPRDGGRSNVGPAFGICRAGI